MKFSKILLAIGAALFCLNVHCQGIANNKVYNTGTPVPKPAVMRTVTEFQNARMTPKLEITDLDGKEVDLKKYEGNLILLNAWATWCHTCLGSMPRLIALQQALKDSNIKFIGINIDVKPEEVAPFLKKHKIENFETLSDAKQSVANLLPLSVVPTVYILDGKGNLVGFVRGEVLWTDKDAIEYLKNLANKYANPDMTKSVEKSF